MKSTSCHNGEIPRPFGNWILCQSFSSGGPAASVTGGRGGSTLLAVRRSTHVRSERSCAVPEGQKVQRQKERNGYRRRDERRENEETCHVSGIHQIEVGKCRGVKESKEL